MNENTIATLSNFLATVAQAVCKCTVREKIDGHHPDCFTPELEDKAKKVTASLRNEVTKP